MNYLKIIPFITFFIFLFFNTKMPDNHQKRQFTEKKSGAMNALQFWTDARAYPNADIPPNKYQNNFEVAKKQYSKVPADILSIPPWRSLGPLNVNGRTICVAVNPKNGNTVYAGTASGGLWRSFTGGLGNDWHRVITGFPVLGVKAIAIDPVDTNVIYIGTGEVYRYQGTHGGVAIRTTRGCYGIGILKTTDGGNTWARVDTLTNKEIGVQGLTINPHNHNTIFAATTEGVYKSRDAGLNWELVLPVLMAQNVIFYEPDTMIMMASCGNLSSPGAGIYLSYDAGDFATWFPSPTAPKFSGKAILEPYKLNPINVYVSFADSTTAEGDLYVTKDFGMSWNLIRHYDYRNDLFGVQGWYSHFVAVHPFNENMIIHAGTYMSRSTDGGNIFLMDPTVHPDHHGYARVEDNPDIIYEVNDAGIVRSTDFGMLFDDIGYGMQTTQFYNGFANSASDSNFAFGSMQDHIPSYAYTGSLNWQEINVDEVGWCVIDPVNSNIIYWCNRQGGVVYKSNNRGNSISAINGFDGYGAWNSPLVLSQSDRNVLYFGKEKIYKSTDGAISWYATAGGSPLDGNPALSMAVSYTNPDTVYIGTAPIYNNAHIYRTTNGGTTWQNITGTLPDRYPMDIAVDPRNSNNVYIAYGGFGTGHVYKSSNGGLGWTNITGNLPDVPTTALLVDPYNSNIIYAGNDISVYISTNGGMGWNSYNDGLPEAIFVSDLGVCNANGTIRVSTHGNGLFERKLYSVATSIQDELPPLPNSVVLNQNYPNPFNPITTISFTVNNTTFISLKIYDVLGKEITTLLNERKQPGEYKIEWKPENIPSGIYFCKIQAEKISISKKMMLVK